MVKLKGNKNTTSPSTVKNMGGCESMCEIATNSILETNLQYVYQCADVNAAKVVAVTRNAGDFAEYRDQMVYDLVKAMPSFDSRRAAFKTFAALVISQSASRIIRCYIKRSIASRSKLYNS